MFTARTAVVSIITGKQLAALSLPKMNKTDGIIHDGSAYEVTNVTVYKGRQIVYVGHPRTANMDWVNTLSWERDGR